VTVIRVLTLKAYWLLIVFHFYLARGNFATLHDKVGRCPVAPQGRSRFAIDDICRAMDLACIWYPQEVLCLQRSAATTCLLRRFGFSARLIVGARPMPFQAHAWVEVNGEVVNDKPYIPKMYAVLDRY
jgi:hypothetical protein